MALTEPRTPEPGTPVEVRNRFDGSWAGGFVLAGVDDDGTDRDDHRPRFWVRRAGEHAPLPAPLPLDQVRPLR